MPCYKDGKTLEVAVNSLLDQDHKNLEVIIVNDGSPDNASEIIKRLEKKDKRVRSLTFKRNVGACKARNEGAKLAKGRYLSFLPADAFLYPGNARVWVEALDARPEYDFLYGGYRFVKEGTLSPYGGEGVMDYKSEPFDPYLLETTNYIDGSFPMKKQVFEKVGGWSEDVKSLQDWDLWLKIVKSGSKGLFYSDIFFETEYPHPGGLSFDSANNWIERTNYIKKKNGIPLRNYCVASLGASWHAKNIAKLLDADFKDMPSFKPHEYEAIYVIGFYPQFADLQGQMFLNSEANPQMGLTPAKKVVHFVGTDIWQLRQLNWQQLEFFRQYFKANVDVVLCEDKFTQDELKELKIDAEIVPIPPIELPKLQPLPEEFSVAVYMPGVNKDFYQPQLMQEVAALMPDVKFKFFGDQDERKVIGNIEYLGYLSREGMADLITNSSCLLRMPIHDGLSINAIEFLLAGRQVVISTPVKHAIHTKNDKYAIRNSILKAQKAGQNKEGSAYWRKAASHKKFKNTMYKLFQYDPKTYWERRATAWDRQAGETLPDLQELEPLFKQLKPASVLDVGCGNGKWYPYFAVNNVNYRGIDISEGLIHRAQEKFPDAAKLFKVCKLEDVPKVKQKFDLAFCYTVLEHVTEGEFPKAVKALKGIAKHVILVEPINFKSRHYCHSHHYEDAFNVVKKVKLSDKMIYVIKN